MPIPSVVPDFATQTNYTMDGDPHEGTPTKVDPGAPRRTEGFEPGAILTAQGLNFMLNNHGQWIDYLTDEASRIDGDVIEVAGAIDARLGGLVSGSGEWAYPSVRARAFGINIEEAKSYYVGSTFEWSVSGLTPPARWYSQADFGRLIVPLNAYLRNGMAITGLDVRLKPGAARTGTNRAFVRLCYRESDFLTPSAQPTETILQSFTHPDSSTALQSIGSGLTSHTVVRGNVSGLVRDYYLRIEAGSTGAASPDEVSAIALYVNDPGPRNF